jgi:hypothetical protein
MRMWTGVGACLCLLLPGTVRCQDSARVPLFDPPAGYPVAVSFFAPLFLPKILQDEYRMKEFICDEEFLAFRRTYGDVNAVDAIFNRALHLSWNNVYEALLLCFLSTMEHRNFGVKLPVLGSLLWLPLTSEFPDEFHRRVKALPAQIYDDSPRGNAGDRAKLQHFFGSALITYVTESRDAAQRVGLFVEWGEDRFVVGGVLDERDIRANMQGQDFGTWLLEDATVLPSKFLGGREHMPAQDKGCVPRDVLDSIDVLAEER